MPPIRALIGLVAGAIALAALIPYIRSILDGETKPNPVSWFVWAMLGAVQLFSYRAAGASDTIWTAIAYAIIPCVVFLMSLKYGDLDRTSAFDIGCLVAAVVSLVPWIVFRSPQFTLYLSLVIDFLGAIPTLRKAAIMPQSEAIFPWFVGYTASALNLAALGSFAPAISLYPVYSFLRLCAITGTLLLHQRPHAPAIPAL